MSTVAHVELTGVREDLNLSRALFAVYLRTNVRTLENWEQGRAKPNAQAALLINLVKKYPDTVQRLRGDLISRRRDGREPPESAAPTPSRSRSTRES